MKSTAKLRKQANTIAARYNGYRDTYEILKMYDELEELGITTGMLCNDSKHCEWYYNGIEIENSVYVYSVYKGQTQNDYTIYFS